MLNVGGATYTQHGGGLGFNGSVYSWDDCSLGIFHIVRNCIRANNMFDWDWAFNEFSPITRTLGRYIRLLTKSLGEAH